MRGQRVGSQPRTGIVSCTTWFSLWVATATDTSAATDLLLECLAVYIVTAIDLLATICISAAQERPRDKLRQLKNLDSLPVSFQISTHKSSSFLTRRRTNFPTRPRFSHPPVISISTPCPMLVTVSPIVPVTDTAELPPTPPNSPHARPHAISSLTPKSHKRIQSADSS